MSNSLQRHLESRQKLRKKMIVDSILKKRKCRLRDINYLIQVDSVIQNNPLNWNFEYIKNSLII